MGKIILIVIISAIVIIASPLAAIWALNTLFPLLAIPYTLDTWFAAFIVQAVLKSQVSIKK